MKGKVLITETLFEGEISIEDFLKLQARVTQFASVYENPYIHAAIESEGYEDYVAVLEICGYRDATQEEINRDAIIEEENNLKRLQAKYWNERKGTREFFIDNAEKYSVNSWDITQQEQVIALLKGE